MQHKTLNPFGWGRFIRLDATLPPLVTVDANDFFRRLEAIAYSTCILKSKKRMTQSSGKVAITNGASCCKFIPHEKVCSSCFSTELLRWLFFRPRGQRSWRRLLTSMRWLPIIRWDTHLCQWISNRVTVWSDFRYHAQIAMASSALIAIQTGKMKLVKRTHVRIC